MTGSWRRQLGEVWMWQLATEAPTDVSLAAVLSNKLHFHTHKQENDFHAFKITLAFVVIPLFLIKNLFSLINLRFNCSIPLLNMNNAKTCPLLKLLCPSVLSHSNNGWGLMYYSDGIIVFTVWRTSAGYICHLFLMRLCFVFSFLITPGNESPQDSSVLLCVYHFQLQSDRDCEEKQQTQTEETREEFTRETEWKHIRDTVLSSRPGYNFGQSGKQCNQLIKHLRTEPALTVAFMSAGRPSSFFSLPLVNFDMRLGFKVTTHLVAVISKVLAGRVILWIVVLLDCVCSCHIFTALTPQSQLSSKWDEG